MTSTPDNTAPTAPAEKAVTADATFTLSPDDIAALACLVCMQGDVSASPLTDAGQTDFMAQLFTLAYGSPGNFAKVTNANVLNQMTQFTNQLVSTQTNYGVTIPSLFLAYQWGRWMQSDYNGQHVWYYQSYMWNQMMASSPPGPPNWQQAVAAAYNTISVSTNPGDLIYNMDASTRDGIGWNAYPMVYNYQYSLVTTAKWTDAAQIVTSALALWTTQSVDLATLVSGGSLANQQCLYLLYILTGLCSSPNTADITTVNNILNLDTNSPEYPNDTFADQLTYFVLMELIDPKGSYGWPQSELITTLQNLSAALTANNAPTQLMQKTLTQQIAVLHSTASYPMVDPYNPATPFPQRESDTLFAINQAWATLTPSSGHVG